MKIPARLYISGPITGYPDNNRETFKLARQELEALFWDLTPFGDVITEIIDPHDLGKLPGDNWADYLKRDIAVLVTCDAVATLPGWQESNGASLEVHVAKALGLTVKPLVAWLKEGTKS